MNLQKTFLLDNIDKRRFVYDELDNDTKCQISNSN